MSQIALSLLLPTFNESEIIGDALLAIQKELGTDFCKQTEILVVDDGQDDLPEKVKDLGAQLQFASVKVLRNNPPLGKGQSLAKGFDVATAPIVGFMDVDLSTPPRYIREALRAIHDEHFDMFIGSRKAPGALVNRQQPLFKDILGGLLGVMARRLIFFGMRNYRDTQCGFKFFKNHIAKVLYRDLFAKDGLADLEVLFRANLMNYRVKEVGVEWTDLRESKRSLKRILMGEVVAILNILGHYRFSPSFQRKRIERMAMDIKSK